MKRLDRFDRIAEKRICIVEMYGARFPTQKRRRAAVAKEAAALRRVDRAAWERGKSYGYMARIAGIEPEELVKRREGRKP